MTRTLLVITSQSSNTVYKSAARSPVLESSQMISRLLQSSLSPQDTLPSEEALPLKVAGSPERAGFPLIISADTNCSDRPVLPLSVSMLMQSSR